MVIYSGIQKVSVHERIVNMATFAWYHFVIGAFLIVASIIIIIAVMLQQSQQEGLSGAIAGGSDSFFDKNKGRTTEAKLAKITKFVGIAFMAVALGAVILFAFLN